MRIITIVLLILFSLQSLSAQEKLDYAKKRVTEVAQKYEKAQSRMDRYNQLTDWINIYKPPYDRHTAAERKLDADIQQKFEAKKAFDEKQGFTGDTLTEKAKNGLNSTIRWVLETGFRDYTFDAYRRARDDYKAATDRKLAWQNSIDKEVWNEQIKFKDPANPQKADDSGGFVYVRTYDQLKATMERFRDLRDALGNPEMLATNVTYYRFQLDDAQQKLTALQSPNDRTIRIPINPDAQPKPPMTGAGSVESALPHLIQPESPNRTTNTSVKPDASIRIVEPVFVDTGSGKGLHRIHRFYVEIKSNTEADVFVRIVDLEMPSGQITNHFTLKDLSFAESKYPVRTLPKGDRLFIPARRPLNLNESSTQTVGPFYLTTWQNKGHRGSWTATFEISHRKDDAKDVPKAIRKTIKFAPKAPKGSLIVEYPKAEKLESIDVDYHRVLVRVQVPGLQQGPHNLIVRVNNIKWHVWARTPKDAELTEFKWSVPYPAGPFKMTFSVPDAPELGSQSLNGSGALPSESAADRIERARNRVKSRQAQDQSKSINQWFLGDAWLKLSRAYSSARDYARALECARRAEPLLPTPKTFSGRHYSGGFKWRAWESQLEHAFRLGDVNAYRQALEKWEAYEQENINSAIGNDRKKIIGSWGLILRRAASELLMLGVPPQELTAMINQAREYVKEGTGRDLDTSWFPFENDL